MTVRRRWHRILWHRIKGHPRTEIAVYGELCCSCGGLTRAGRRRIR